MMKLLNISLLFFGFLVFSQNPEKNKQLEKATNLIFSNPEKSAQISAKVFADTDDYNLKIAALSKMVNAQMVLSDISEVIRNCATGIEMAKDNNDKVNQIRFLSMLGNQYQQLNMNSDAKKNLDEAENLINAEKLPEELLFIKGNVYNVKGIVFKNELNCDFAIKYFNKALAVYDKLPHTDVIATNKLLIEIQKAVCLESLGNTAEAEELYKKVLAENNINLGYNMYFAAGGLADIYLKNRKIAEANRIIESIHVKDFDQYDPELTVLFYKLKAKISYLKNDYSSYLYYFDKYDDNINKVANTQNEIINKLIKSNSANDTAKRKEKSIRNILLICVLVIAFSTILLVFRRFLTRTAKS